MNRKNILKKKFIIVRKINIIYKMLVRNTRKRENILLANITGNMEKR